MSGTLHPQVRIRHGGTNAAVDEKLAPLIRELWRAGWLTVRSCQRHESGKVWIEFDSRHLNAFLNVAIAYDPRQGSLWRRARVWGFGSFGRASEPISDGVQLADAWEYHVTMTDGSHDDAANVLVAVARDFGFSVSVLFPRRDLKTVLARVRAHNGKAPKAPRGTIGGQSAAGGR